MNTHITAPAFPVPADLNGFWMFDRVHAPRPLTPLSQEVLLSAMTEGFCAGMKEAGYPLGLCYRPINYYGYCTFLPHHASDHPAGANTDAIATLLPRLAERWEHEWLPSILPGLERLRTLDYAALSDGELWATLDDLRRDLVARWCIHGFLLFSYQSASAFEEFYRSIFEPADTTEPHLLLSGVRTRAFAGDCALWRLGRIVRASPALRQLFAETSCPELLESLANIEEGQDLLRELQVYLDEFGWHSDAIMELAEPLWREDPAVALNALRGLVALDDSESPDQRLQTIKDRRDRLLAAARAKLADQPSQLNRFEALFEQVRDHVAVDEDHNFYIDQMGNVGLRFPVLELGRRLVRHDAVDRPEDVFLLTMMEIRAGLDGNDQRERVAKVRAEMAHWAGVTPPATLGEPPSEEGLDPFMIAIAKLDAPPVPHPQTDTLIRGTPASPGLARGRAKVARNLEEASSIEAGEILVCEMTLPSWSALFATAAGVVADTGGILCHCATVAREYGIPSVVGTIVGTTAIRNGAMLEIDGSKGEVRILGRPA